MIAKYKTYSLILFILVASFITPLRAQGNVMGMNEEQLLSKADSMYVGGDYLSAIELYEGAISQYGISATLYMNLGNAYFKRDNIAKAILYYERAYLLDPSDKDIEFNLQLARSRIVDKEITTHKIFLVRWYERIVSLCNLNGWSAMVIGLITIAVVFAIIFILCKSRKMKKISFYLAIVCFVFSILSFIFATTQMRELNSHKAAIITTPSVTVKSTPSDSGTDLFIIHEGRKVNLLDSSMKEWVEIELEDGNKGWVRNSVMDII